MLCVLLYKKSAAPLTTASAPLLQQKTWGKALTGKVKSEKLKRTGAGNAVKASIAGSCNVSTRDGYWQLQLPTMPFM